MGIFQMPSLGADMEDGKLVLMPSCLWLMSEMQLRLITEPSLLQAFMEKDLLFVIIMFKRCNNVL